MKGNSVVQIFLLILVSCKNSSPNIKNGYNELENADSLKIFTISNYNRDDPNTKNIKTPKSSIIKTEIDTTKLFKIWVANNDSPHADFVFGKNNFYVVDYDGNGEMKYELIGNKLKIYYNDFLQEGEIISVDNEKLKIRWKDSKQINEYVIWKN